MGSAEDKIYALTGIDKLMRSAMARYYGKLTEAERVEVFALAYDLARKNIERADGNIRGKPIYFYSMMCVAIWKMQWTREALAKKNPNLTADQSREITARRVASVLAARNDRMKRGRLKVLLDVRLYHVVQELRNNGLSWRECSAYLLKYHHTRISHVHVRKLFIKITEDRKKREGKK